MRVGEEAELGGGDGVRAVGRNVGSEGGVAVSCVGFSERTNEKLSLRVSNITLSLVIAICVHVCMRVHVCYVCMCMCVHRYMYMRG